MRAARCMLGLAGYLAFCPGVGAEEKHVWTLEHVAALRSVSEAAMAPDGSAVAFVLQVPRIPYKDEDGPAWRELHVAEAARQARPYVAGKVSVGDIAWTPDSSAIVFLAKREGDEHRAVYLIPVRGGEAQRKVTHEEDIEAFSLSPDGHRIAFLARPPRDKKKKKLEEKGFRVEVYEEDWRPVKVYIASLDDAAAKPRVLDLPGSASELHWSPVDDRLVVALAPTPLIDDHYMRRKVHVVDAGSGRVLARLDNPGKLGPVAWSPDGRSLAFISAADLHDPREGRLVVASASGGPLTDVLPGFAGHVIAFAWQDADTLLYVGHEGVGSVFGEVRRDGSARKTIVAAGEPILNSLSLSRDGRRAAFVADSPAHPAELYVMAHGDRAPARWTTTNPEAESLRRALQEVVRYRARDGLEIEGLLIRPLDARAGQRYPLILVVHGGPEAHYSNGWLTSYAAPGQVAAARGFAVFYPNYRGSTGRGVAFSKLHQGDYAGREFDDLVDGVDYLVAQGLVDAKRVGVTGGSYGGFATAWCATRYSERFAAAVMFVGIADHVSKAGTTDIPWEMYLVHARRWPWEAWDWFRERSPLYHVEQARTPILIAHGKEDPRVHPSQSLALYRYLKVLERTPVRLVFYPGEGHGNRRAATRYDFSRRLMQWMEHYLQGPGGAPPPYELELDLRALGVEEEGEEEENPQREQDPREAAAAGPGQRAPAAPARR